MAISITWSTHVINVPKADMTLVASTPSEIRELDLDVFRKALNDIMDDEEGIVFETVYEHTPPTTISGVLKPRIVRILAPYTLTFEDGQYIVDIAGGDSNILDVLNTNQVSVRSRNISVEVKSKGLTLAEFLALK